MSAIIIADEVVHYEVLGRGRPLVFVHGWLGSWRYWIPTMQALSAEYRAYALDLWGFGDTAKVGARYHLEAQVDLVYGFLEQMGIGKAALVGHGLGGAVVARFVRRYPEAVDRAMGVSVPLDAAAISPRLTAGPAAALVEALLSREAAVEPISREAAKADPRAIEATVRTVSDCNLRTELATVQRPYLLVYGEKDPLISPPDDAWLGGLNGSVHGLGLENSRHFPMLDEAAKFNRLLYDLLALSSGESLKHLELKEEWRRRVR